MSKESEDLEELLGKVTPEPWNVSTPVEGVPGFRVIQHGEYGHSDCGRYFCTSGQISSHDATIIALAPSLARRVIAAEKLVTALRWYASDEIAGWEINTIDEFDEFSRRAASALAAFEDACNTYSTPDVASASAVSGEPHTEAGAGVGAEASALARLKAERQRFLDDACRYNDQARQLRGEVADLGAQLAAMTAERDALVGAAKVLNDHYERNICYHENTHRGGTIWTICDDCGRQWADDRGGFTSFDHPAEVIDAKAILAAAQKEAGK